MSNTKRVISAYLAKAAYSLLAAGTNLSHEDVRKLREEGPKLAKKVKEGKGKALEDFTEDDKRLLLAYVVYFRQNLSTDNNTNPNDEDAAKILHGKIFEGDDKETKKRMLEELVRQLQKSGVKLDDK